MKLVFLCLAVAVFLLLPALSDLRQFPLPYRGLIGIPALFLEYITVFLHEMGHTISRWLFGYLAYPVFDFQRGGGMKADFRHSNILLGAIYAGMGLGFFLILAKRAFKIAGIMAVLCFVHISFMFGQGHEAFIYYMGHGCELLVASFLIVHAARGEAVGGWIRQYLTMIFGLYLMGKNVILSLGLGTGPARMREAYAKMDGVHVAGDFTRIAQLVAEDVQTVAMCSLAVTVLCAGVITFLAVYLPAHERLGNLK